jgi:hypothetical protein
MIIHHQNNFRIVYIITVISALGSLDQEKP